MTQLTYTGKEHIRAPKELRPYLRAPLIPDVIYEVADEDVDKIQEIVPELKKKSE